MRVRSSRLLPLLKHLEKNATMRLRKIGEKAESNPPLGEILAQEPVADPPVKLAVNLCRVGANTATESIPTENTTAECTTMDTNSAAARVA